MAMNGWKFDLTEIPIDKPFLVFLSDKHQGSRVHTGIKMKISNGYITLMGGYFADDLGLQILAWRPMVALPGRVNNALAN